MKSILFILLIVIAYSKLTDPDSNCVFYKCPDEWRSCLSNDACDKHLT